MTSLSGAFREGGWPMFPILICGLLQCAAALRYALRPERQHLKLPVALGALTLLWGAAGFVMGLILSLSALHVVAPDQRWIVLVGLGECLNDVALALLLSVFSATLVAVGVFRSSPPQGAGHPLPLR